MEATTTQRRTKERTWLETLMASRNAEEIHGKVRTYQKYESPKKEKESRDRKRQTKRRVMGFHYNSRKG